MEEGTIPLHGKKRVAWVDASRCTAMFFIMWLHAGAPSEWIVHLINGALLLFFFWAGYFMPQQAGPCAVRALKLMLVWVVWTLIGMVDSMIFHPAPVDWTQLLGWGTSSYNPPLWFLRALFIFQFIMAGLLALRILPRYKWLVLVAVTGFCYASGLQQHETLSFSWMKVMVLGVCVRGVPLEAIRTWLLRNTWALIALSALLYAQWQFYPEALDALELKCARCSLPLTGFIWAAGFCLLSIHLEIQLPRIARSMAAAGACMMFCYVAHHIFYSFTVYMSGVRFATNFWAPLITLPALTWLHSTLSRRHPRTMDFLCGR